MDEIILRQRDAAKPLTGKAFLLSIARIVLKLAIVQMAIRLLIAMTAAELLNIALYLYAAWQLWSFLKHTVASYTYTLKTKTLVLQRRVGDSTTKLVEIPLSAIRAIRPVRYGEDMRLYYSRVLVIDPACRPSLRIRAGFALSYVSAHAARAAAGKRVGDQAGHAVVFEENGTLNCCVFRPKDQLRAVLEEVCGDAFGADDFAGRKPLDSVRARCLQRAFPALYPHVKPLMNPEEVIEARAELAARKAARKAKKEANRHADGKAAQGKKQNGPKRSGSKDLQHKKQAGPSGESEKESGEKHEVHDDSV